MELFHEPHGSFILVSEHLTHFLILSQDAMLIYHFVGSWKGIVSFCVKLKVIVLAYGFPYVRRYS